LIASHGSATKARYKGTESDVMKELVLLCIRLPC
jgi:hypothetical protein